MSIIEKAVDKLGGQFREKPPIVTEPDEPPAPTPAVNPAQMDAVPASAVNSAPAMALDEPPTESGPTLEIDFDKLATAGVVTPDASNKLLVEQFRMIKQPLLMKVASNGKVDAAENGNLIMVASALPGEGKTSVSLSLAMSIAMERDRTVLLVDADVMKADISRVLGISEGLGLTDYLASDDKDLADLLVRTEVPTLTVLPAGRRHPNLTELLASDGMARLTRELSRRYRDRIIVFDSPPLLSSAGAKVLANLMGQVVMVVEAVRTPQNAVAEALRILGPMDNIGLVLNKSRQRTVSGYGSGYGYGYGYGYGRRGGE